MVVTLSQQYNVGEKPTVILYTYINRHAGTPEKQQEQTYGWWLTSAAAEDRSTGFFWGGGLGGWYLDVEKPICHLSLLPILLNCVRSHVDLYCVRSVRASSSSDR